MIKVCFVFTMKEIKCLIQGTKLTLYKNDVLANELASGKCHLLPKLEIFIGY